MNRNLGRHLAIGAGIACLAAGLLAARPAAGMAAGMTAPPKPINGSLFSVSASSATDAWAVGARFGGQALRTLTEHWDGKSWQRVKSLSPGGVGHNAELFGVTALSPRNAWAVGYFSDGTLNHTLVEHWNGKAWTHVPSPSSGNAPGDVLEPVSAVSPTDIWAAGVFTNSVSLTDTAAVMHWNGKSRRGVGAPNPGGFLGSELVSVDAVSAHDVWAVGDYPNGDAQARQTLAVHWNGTKWKLVPSPTPDASAQESGLSGVTATSAANAWAVGFYTVGSFQRAIILHWNGRAWRRQL